MPLYGSSPASNDSVALAINENPGFSSPASPTVLAETIPAYTATTAYTPASGDLFIWPVDLAVGQSVGHVGYVTSTTAGNPIHQWACVVDNTYTVRAVSADGGTATLAASTWTSVPMTSAYVPSYSGRHFLGVAITGGTEATICATSAGPLVAMITGSGAPNPVLGGQSNTGVTTPLAVGTVVTTPTATADVPYMYCTA